MSGVKPVFGGLSSGNSPPMPNLATIWFLATAKSGLGHLRRISTIAGHMANGDKCPAVGLMTNAGLSGLEESDRRIYAHVAFAERAEMAGRLAAESVTGVVVDTAIVPRLDRRDEPLVLILREMSKDRIEGFRLLGGRPWDLVIIPNPENHWMPNLARGFTRNVLAVGWIYRLSAAAARPMSALPKLLIATGGGGKAEGAAALRAQIDGIIASLRACTSHPFTVEQALAARAPPQARLHGADRVFDPGGALNDCFAAADIVVSTAGYNSVLELAMTETPTMLVPIERSIDDQVARAKLWGPRVGCFLDPEAPVAAVDWLKRQIETPARRPPVDLGPSGAAAAARDILALL